MIEVSLSLIEQDVTKISPKICLHWDMRRTVPVVLLICIAGSNYPISEQLLPSAPEIQQCTPNTCKKVRMQIVLVVSYQACIEQRWSWKESSIIEREM